MQMPRVTRIIRTFKERSEICLGKEINMEARNELFFRLLRFALGTEKNCPKMHLNEWREMFQIAKKHAITGFIGSALKNIGGDVLIEKDATSQDAFTDLIMDWMGEVVKIARRNQKVNHDVIEVFGKLERQGVECCLLKGQGNALMYPDSNTRTSGDIDVWGRFANQANDKTNIHRLIRLVKANHPESKAAYHHIDVPNINATPVELHYRPQFLLSFVYNRRLQKYFADNMDEQFGHKVNLENVLIAVPTPEFNVIFQLCHIFNHLTHEGIGIRQILDYYFILQKLSEQIGDKSQLSKTLHRLGLLKFAGAIMWILVFKLGMNGLWAIAGLDEKRGRFVLNEIMQGGNFGKFDHRSEVKYYDNPIIVQYRHLIRNLHLLRFFPHEALVEPFGRGVIFFKKVMLNK